MSTRTSLGLPATRATCRGSVDGHNSRPAMPFTRRRGVVSGLAREVGDSGRNRGDVGPAGPDVGPAGVHSSPVRRRRPRGGRRRAGPANWRMSRRRRSRGGRRRAGPCMRAANRSQLGGAGATAASPGYDGARDIRGAIDCPPRGCDRLPVHAGPKGTRRSSRKRPGSSHGSARPWHRRSVPQALPSGTTRHQPKPSFVHEDPPSRSGAAGPSPDFLQIREMSTS